MIKPYYNARKKKHLKNIQNMSQYHRDKVIRAAIRIVIMVNNYTFTHFRETAVFVVVTF